MYNCPMQTPATPIIVRVVEQNEVSGLGDVMLQAIGLTGVIAIAAFLFGIVLASVIIGYRAVQARFAADDEPETQPLGLTPTLRD